MLDFLTYDFGYNWIVSYGHAIPLAVFGAAAGLAVWRGWPRWPAWCPRAAAARAVWGPAGLLITHALIRINLPVAPPTERFLASGAGRVLDAGAGSGRAAIGVLLARPHATVTALDIYQGF